MKWEPAKGSGSSGKKKGRGRGCLTAVAVVVAIALIGGIARCGGGGEENGPLEWPSSGLATMLPKPSSDKGEVHTNTDDTFRADVSEYSTSDYEEYVTACREKGFAVDEVRDSLGWEAYSEEGAHLKLTYLESSEEMSIALDAAVELGTIAWPTMGAGALAPAPTSTTGKIDSDSSTYFSATVGETSAEDYAAYVDACIGAGFDVDYNRGEKSFSADDASGNHVSVDYKGANMMVVSVSVAEGQEAPPETEDSVTAEETSEPETTVESPAEVDAASDGADFRAMVDEYEAFMNEYCDFMEKYDSDSGNVVSMAVDYASMMSRYAEWAKKMDAVDESALSTEDSLYLLDAQNRINQRLLSIGQ